MIYGNKFLSESTINTIVLESSMENDSIVLENFCKTLENATGFYLEDGTSIGDGLKNALAAIKNFIDKIIKFIKDAIEGAINWFKNLFKKKPEAGSEKSAAGTEKPAAGSEESITVTYAEYSDFGAKFPDHCLAKAKKLENIVDRVKAEDSFWTEEKLGNLLDNDIDRYFPEGDKSKLKEDSIKKEEITVTSSNAKSIIDKFNKSNFFHLINKFEDIRSTLDASANKLKTTVEGMEKAADTMQSNAGNNDDYNKANRASKITAGIRNIANHIRLLADATSKVLFAGKLNAHKNIREMNRINKTFNLGMAMVNPQDTNVSVSGINS